MAVQATSGAEALDRKREALGYNYSIYLMLAMPYLLIGGLGFLIYRGVKLRDAANEEELRKLEQGESTDSSGDSTSEPV